MPKSEDKPPSSVGERDKGEEMSFPTVLPIKTTENTIEFFIASDETKISVSRADFEKNFKEFMNWRNNVSATNFSSELFRLMCHADFINARKILKGFPVRSILYSLWYNSKTEENFEKTVKKYILQEGETENEL